MHTTFGYEKFLIFFFIIVVLVVIFTVKRIEQFFGIRAVYSSLISRG